MTQLSFELKKLTESTSSSAATALGTTIGNLGGYDSVGVVTTLTGVPGGTLDVYLQGSINGTEWYDVVHFPQLSSSASAVTYACGISNCGNQGIGIKVVGTSTSPALAANTIAGAGFGAFIRPVYVTGSGTSASASQVLRFYGFKNQF